MIQLDVILDATGVNWDLERIQVGIGPTSLAAFLGSQGKEILQHRAEVRFADEGDSASGDWQQLAFPTRRIRAAKGFPPEHPINVRTGELRAFVTGNDGSVSTTGTAARLLWPGEVSGELSLKYATAQRGRNRPPTPARPVAAIDALDLELFMVAAGSFLDTATGLRFA